MAMRRFTLFALLVAAVATLLPSQEVEARRGAKARFRVLSFNIRYDFENDGANRWQNRVDMVAHVIDESLASVICLQEDKKHQVDDLKSRLDRFQFVGRGRNATGSGERCSILFDTRKFKLKESGDFWLSDTPEVPGSNTWGDRYPRKVTWALLVPKRAKSKSLLVLNTHFVDGNRPDLREKSAHVVKNWLKSKLGESDKVAVVVTGDFNAGEGDAPHQILTGGGLRDTFLEARPKDPSPGTFNGFRGMQTRERIDWILTSGPTRVYQTAKLDYNEGGKYPSDHYPIMADLEIR
jgi:endonuclease/exonuclease/phosphatase family metal-dependent hydrolase